MVNSHRVFCNYLGIYGKLTAYLPVENGTRQCEFI